jgi:UDP:flavonoid glycosyltransferase YjiC (YdhE family)
MGDFRLSLYISARKAGKPYGAIANAYWSRRYWTKVDAPPVRPLSWLPGFAANAVFRTVYPVAFAAHALPFHRTCSFYGVNPPRLDIRDIYTASDTTAFGDVDAFYEEPPVSDDGPLFLGPLAWEPANTQRLPPFADGDPIVFISVGSSGVGVLRDQLLDAVRILPVRCIVATGNGGSVEVPPNCIFQSAFVPYAEASKVAALVVCNGGAPATYAALREGRPVVGAPRNLDQMLNMRVVERVGGGATIPAREVEGTSIAAALRKALFHGPLRRGAHRAAQAIAKVRERERVNQWLARLTQA